MSLHFARVVVASVLFALPSAAQLTLTTSYLGNTYQSGNMFDVTATNALVVDNFDVNILAGTSTVEIYARTGGGPYLPVVAVGTAWTLVGSAVVTSTGNGVPTPVPVNVNIAIGATQTQGFYLTTTGAANAANGMVYTIGVVQGGPWAQDANMQVPEGNAVVYPFGGAIIPRDWNGTIHYHLGSIFPTAFTATTSGGGVGDLNLALSMIPAGANEGYLLVSGTATGLVGSGPFIGIYPDGLTFALLQEPLNVGDPLHFVVGPTGVFPDQPFILPSGTLLLGGQVWDAVTAFFGPGFVYLGQSNVQRLVW